MKIHATIGIFLIFLASFAPSAALPQAQCGARSAVIANLAERYGETRRGVGIAANNTLMEVFASDQSGSWTITVTTHDGQTCLVASGQSYEATSEPATPPGTPG